MSEAYTATHAGTVLERWTTDDGYECIVMVGPMGALNGYVRVPEDHPWRQLGYSDAICGHGGCYEHTPSSQIDVHGGVTFDGCPQGVDGGFWFGFDCAHAGDLVPGLRAFPGDVYRDAAYVHGQCERLAAQLAAQKDDPGPKEAP